MELLLALKLFTGIALFVPDAENNIYHSTYTALSGCQTASKTLNGTCTINHKDKIYKLYIEK